MVKISKIITKLSIVFFLCTATACDPWTSVYVTIENKSTETIYLSCRTNFDYLVILDGIIKRIQKLECNQETLELFEVGPGEENDQYCFMIIKESTLNKYTKQEMIDNNIYDKLYLYYYDELKAMDFRIVYTGD